jgi:hypothetical protein
MRLARVTASAIVSAAVLLGVFVAAPAARSSVGSPALDGTFVATSNGEWAKTNEVYRDEATVVSTWTITSACSSPVECSGEVRSDQGWTATAHMSNGVWRIDRDLDGWERCADGTAAPGHQIYRFWPVDANGQIDTGSAVMAGEDRTTGPSGGCGINQWLVVKMPFKLIKTG